MDALIGDGEINQIIVVTGDRPDLGLNSLKAAGKAYAEGITVSIMGIMNSRSSDEKASRELEELARAGGGLCEYTDEEHLNNAIQNITLKTIRKAMEQEVERQFKALIGVEIENLESVSKIKIEEFIQKYEEIINLKCIILLDIGERMKNRLDIFKGSEIKLLERFHKRKGKNNIAVLTYTGESIKACRILCGFTDDVSILGQKEIIYQDRSNAAGYAILKACELIHRYCGVFNGDI